MRRKPGLTSLDQWEFIGLESLAMQNAVKILNKHQKAEREDLLEKHNSARGDLEKNLKSKYGKYGHKEKKEKHRLTLNGREKSSRLAMDKRHVDQHRELENSQDPVTKAYAIIKGENLNNAKTDYLRAELMLDQHHRDQTKTLHDQEQIQIKELSKMHKDGVISNQSFHYSLGKLMEASRDQTDIFTKDHEQNVENVYKSSQPIHTANEITNPIDDRFERVSENFKDLENYISALSRKDSASTLSDEYENAPDELGIAEIHHTELGAVVAMPSQDLDDFPERKSILKAQFENSTIMSKSTSQGMER
ncbi:MAG: hypothetical protein ACRBDL_08890 [Alphaproteobacteria bacterium]